MSPRPATVRAPTVTAGSAAARSSAAGCSSPAITRLTSVPPCAAIGVVSELTGLGLLLDGEGVEPALGLAGATPPPRALGFAGCRGSGARPAADARVTLVEQWVIRHAVFPDVAPQDRKSTRLNSSHRCISYAVFCLKKKKKQKRESRVYWWKTMDIDDYIQRWREVG